MNLSKQQYRRGFLLKNQRMMAKHTYSADSWLDESLLFQTTNFLLHRCNHHLGMLGWAQIDDPLFQGLRVDLFELQLLQSLVLILLLLKFLRLSRWFGVVVIRIIMIGHCMVNLLIWKLFNDSHSNTSSRSCFFHF